MMEINFVRQAEFENLESLKFDVIICASGFEHRASHFIELLNDTQLNDCKRICFTFQDRIAHSRKINDKKFRSKGFSFLEIRSDDIDNFVNIYGSFFRDIKSKTLSIFFEYSCMTTIMYAGILKYFSVYSSNFDQVTIIFSYTQSKFSKPSKPSSLLFNHPIPLFNPVQPTNKKISLIIGLGYEENKALGLYEYFQNDKNDIYLFITGKNSNPKFYDEVYKNNKELISIINPDNILNYDLDNISHLLSNLDGLVNYLLNTDNRVVLAPIGPKVFSLCSILVNLTHQEVTTYRVSDGSKKLPVDKFEDTEKPLILTELNLVRKKILID